MLYRLINAILGISFAGMAFFEKQYLMFLPAFLMLYQSISGKSLCSTGNCYLNTPKKLLNGNEEITYKNIN